MRSNLPPPQHFIGKRIPGNEDYLIKEELGSGLNARVFRAVNTTTSFECICKIIPRANLVDPENEAWKDEFKKPNTLSTDSHVVPVHDVGDWKSDQVDCVYLLAHRVHGACLRDHLKTSAGSITLRFALDFFREMLEFLYALQQGGFQHGDFHSGNILVEDRTDRLNPPPYAFRVTDFGVAGATSSGMRDDFELLAATVLEILEKVKYTSLNGADRALFNALRNDFVPKRLLEADRCHDAHARDPKRLFLGLQQLEAEITKRQAAEALQSLTSPFDYSSCEQLGDAHSLLQALYSDKFLGLSTVQERNNLVLTGPRGCGKSTVFKSLSLDHRMRTQDAAPERIEYIGVYYRCDDLYFNFPRFHAAARVEATDIPLHFVSASLAARLLRVLSDWLSVHFSADLSGRQVYLSKAAREAFGLERAPLPSADTFLAVADALDGERTRAARKQAFAHDNKQNFKTPFVGPEALLQVCDALTQQLVPLHTRPIYFFIDDYSTPRVSRDLQRNLNRLFMQRTASAFFKLATESPVAFVGSDIDDKSYVEGREYTLVNLGMEFISAAPGEKLEFVDDVFRRRLRAVQDYPVKELRELLGEETQPKSHNETARDIRGNRYPQLWGRRTLGDLCSGDIHFLIRLVGAMVTESGGVEGLARGNEIDHDIQNRAIREEAGSFLRNLRELKDGLRLVEIVEAFGAVAGSFLRFRDSKNENGAPPHQACRIEPVEEPRLEGEARDLYEALLRYSVFLEDVRGKSRRGHFVPRLHLRRFLVPHFNLTFSGRDSLELNSSMFTLLLTAPRNFQDRYRLKDRDQRGDSRQLSLLTPAGNGRGDDEGTES